MRRKPRLSFSFTFAVLLKNSIMRYLDPKADLTFKKVFGEHPHLIISLLNAMLPLEDGQLIESIEYLPTELIPDNPLKKDSIVDVRCRDNHDRQFIVEMQMWWTDDFRNRVLFNATKAYARQLDKGKDYKSLQPVYALSFVNYVYMADTEEFYHHYTMVHQKDSNRKIDGIQLIFIELPKFKPESITDKKMQVLWLRFLTEIEEKTKNVAPELLANPDVKQAIDCLEQAAFTANELYAYEKYWDIISTETTALRAAKEEGVAEGILAGIKEGEQRGAEKIALKLKQSGMPITAIMDMTGLDASTIERLWQ